MNSYFVRIVEKICLSETSHTGTSKLKILNNLNLKLIIWIKRYTLNQLNHFLTVLLKLSLLKGSSKIISNFMDIFFSLGATQLKAPPPLESS